MNLSSTFQFGGVDVVAVAEKVFGDSVQLLGAVAHGKNHRDTNSGYQALFAKNCK